MIEMIPSPQTGTNPVQPRFPPSLGPANGKPGFLSVLCVSKDPLFRDRICRNLERDGGVFVEIAVTADDALHLMSYLSFDIVVTDCISWKGTRNGFLKTMREHGIAIPFIYFTTDFRSDALEEAPAFGRVRVVAWNGHTDSLQFENLVQCIHQMTGSRAAGDPRGVCG